MQDKIVFLQKKIPLAVLQALTPEAIEATPKDQIEDGCIILRSFPFKIGRESRVVKVDGRLERAERPKKGDTEPNNNLYLVDNGHRLNISREHFLIDRRRDHFVLVDRGSACGTKIDGKNVGGEDTGGSHRIADGDVISIGAAGTPYVFKFITFDEFDVVKKTE